MNFAGQRYRWFTGPGWNNFDSGRRTSWLDDFSNRRAGCEYLFVYFADLAGNVGKATLVSIAGTTSSVGTVTIDPVDSPTRQDPYRFLEQACQHIALAGAVGNGQ